MAAFTPQSMSARIAPHHEVSQPEPDSRSPTFSSSTPKIHPSMLFAHEQALSLKSRVWKYVQVDYEGRYSLQKTHCVMGYCTHSNAKALVQLLVSLAPLPLLGLAIELIPLEPPSNGWQRCPRFLLRTWLQMFCMSIATNTNVQEHLQELCLGSSQLALLSMCQSLFFITTLIILAVAAGVFPVPFSFIIVLIIFFKGSWKLRILFLRNVLYSPEDPDGATDLRNRVFSLMKMSTIMPAILIIDTAYTALFSTVGTNQQLMLSVLLPILKIATKNVQWKRLRKLSPQGDDLGCEIIVGFGYYFHTLFMVMCIKTSKSLLVLLLLIGWNVVHDVVSTYTVRCKVHQERCLWRGLSTSDRRGRSRRAVIQDVVIQYAATYEDLIAPGVVRVSNQNELSAKASFHRYRAMSDQLISKPKGKSQPRTLASAVVVNWVNEVMQLFHWRETLLMRLCIDIFVTLSYFFFVTVMHSMPNSAYSINLKSEPLEDSSLVQRFGLQLSAKLLTTAIFLYVLKPNGHDSSVTGNGDQERTINGRQVGPAPTENDDIDILPSGLGQLAFVISSQRRSFLSKLFIVTVFAVNFQLSHFGNDITFQFSWLH